MESSCIHKLILCVAMSRLEVVDINGSAAKLGTGLTLFWERALVLIDC
jgi:hypothetical protein